MAAINEYAPAGWFQRLRRMPSGNPGAAVARSGKFPLWRWVILLVAGVYFLLPLYAAIRFAGVKAFGSVFTQPGFGSSLWVSIQIAAMTWAITMALMVPTTIYVHLRLPAMRRFLESITILPIVIPPIVLTVGVLQVFPIQLKATMWLLGIEYVILAMPFAYRAIDAGLRSIDLKTLTEASSNLGGGWLTTMWRVILPNLGTALLSSTVLIVALCLGEFTMASLNLVTTFPVWIPPYSLVVAPRLSRSASTAAITRSVDEPGRRDPPIPTTSIPRDPMTVDAWLAFGNASGRPMSAPSIHGLISIPMSHSRGDTRRNLVISPARRPACWPAGHARSKYRTRSQSVTVSRSKARSSCRAKLARCAWTSAPSPATASGLCSNASTASCSVTGMVASARSSYAFPVCAGPQSIFSRMPYSPAIIMAAYTR